MSATKTGSLICATFKNHKLARKFEGHDIGEKFDVQGCTNTAIAWTRKSGALVTFFQKKVTRRMMCMVRIVPYNPIAFPPSLEVRRTNVAGAWMCKSDYGEPTC